jgi:Tol biopolymer transport system component
VNGVIRPFCLTLTLVLVTACAASAASPPTISSQTARLTQAPSPTPVPSVSPASIASSAATNAQGQIVFHDDRAASTHQQIYIERADGSGARRLVTSEHDDFKPRLSPDGRMVAFTRDLSRIFVVNVDGTGMREIDKAGCKKPCGGDEDVSWSPDGSQLAVTRNLFDASGPINVAIWVMSADGSGAHQVTLAKLNCSNACKGGAQDNQAEWSPDGKRLVFRRDEYTSPERYGIFTVAVDGSDLRRVTPETMNVDDPAWSPDGTLIAFQSPPDPTPGSEQDIYTIHPDGTGLTKLTGIMGVGGSNHPSWSPGGGQIVFSHFPSTNGVSDLFVMNRDGSGLHLLAATSLNENAPDWGSFPR